MYTAPPLLALRFLGLVASVSAVLDPDPSTVPDPSPLEVRSNYITTSYYSVVTTEISHDEFSIGMGQNGTMGNYYWLSCINNPFTTRGDFAGCGFDDVYTRCSGRTALGIDGDEILCDIGCVTHKVYEDLDVTTFTPLIGCGRGTSTMNLVRTSTSASSDTTSSFLTSGNTGPTDEPDNSSVGLERASFFIVMMTATILIIA